MVPRSSQRCNLYPKMYTGLINLGLRFWNWFANLLWIPFVKSKSEFYLNRSAFKLRRRILRSTQNKYPVPRAPYCRWSLRCSALPLGSLRSQLRLAPCNAGQKCPWHFYGSSAELKSPGDFAGSWYLQLATIACFVTSVGLKSYWDFIVSHDCVSLSVRR